MENFYADILKTQDVIASIIGEDNVVPLFRFPGGSFGSKKEPFRTYLEGTDYRFVDWTSLNNDADGKKLTPSVPWRACAIPSPAGRIPYFNARHRPQNPSLRRPCPRPWNICRAKGFPSRPSETRDHRKEETMKNSIVLTGMPGSGKSTVGVILAKVLCKPFFDTDLLIQEKEDTRSSEGHFGPGWAGLFPPL